MSSYRFKSGSRHQFNASSEAFFHAPAHLTEGTAGPPEGYFPPATLCGVGEQEGGDPAGRKRLLTVLSAAAGPATFLGAPVCAPGSGPTGPVFTPHPHLHRERP